MADLGYAHIGLWLVITVNSMTAGGRGRRGKTVVGRWVGYVAGKRLVIETRSLPKICMDHHFWCVSGGWPFHLPFLFVLPVNQVCHITCPIARLSSHMPQIVF